MTYFANEKNFLDEIISDKIYTDHRYYPVGKIAKKPKTV